MIAFCGVSCISVIVFCGVFINWALYGVFIALIGMSEYLVYGLFTYTIS